MSDFFARFKDLNMLSFFQATIFTLLVRFFVGHYHGPFFTAVDIVRTVCGVYLLYSLIAALIAVKGNANNHDNSPGASANNPIVIDGNPVPPVGAHEWCPDRHQFTGIFKVHAQSKWKCAYDTASNQYGMVIGSRLDDKWLVVIWTTGHVEWRTPEGMEIYYEYYQSEVDEGRGIVPQKLNDMIDAWIQEHHMIRSGMASEADYSAGSVPFVHDYKNRA
jgi:hypothetical protein